ESADSGKQWVVNMDEIGPANKGVMPDEFDAGHDTVRHYALWGSLMAGAGGAEWYFGYKYPHNDLECEDFRSRDQWWDQTRYATSFFTRFLPFYDMVSDDQAVDNEDAYCLTKENEVYAIYLPDASKQTWIRLGGSGKAFTV